MKRVSLGIVGVLIWMSAVAQSPSVSGQYEQSELREVLLDFEKQTGLAFFFEEAWLDTLVVTDSFENTPLNEALNSVLSGTDLSFFLFEGRVILTRNQLIIDKPPLLKSSSVASGSSTIERGLVFSREYLEEESGASLEQQVFEIGSRAVMQPGGTSTIAGYVRDSETKDPVVGALVYKENPLVLTTTDESGFYSLSLPIGKHQLLIQFTGMKPTQRKVVLFSNGKLNIDMLVDVIALQEVTVESDRDLNVKGVQMGVSMINVEEMKTVPIVLGENDILKIATTKPGVQTVGEGASGYNVRGGKADQNLILFNDATIYNPTHFFGFFSSFNSHAIQSLDLYTSGISARFGGRLSSVFDIHGKVANQQEVKGEGGLSPITSRLTVEVPIIENKAGLLLGGRTTYSNWVLKQANSAGFSENKVSFYDLIAQFDYRITEDDDIQASTYISSDQFRLSSDTLFSFSNFSFLNATGSLKWTHRFSPKLEGSLVSTLASYHYEVFYDESLPNAFIQDFDILEISVRAEASYFMTEEKSVQAGLSTKRYGINPGSKRPLGAESLVSTVELQEMAGLESALYASYQQEWMKKLSVSAGLRYVVFQELGPYTQAIYEEGIPRSADSQIDTVRFGKGETMTAYHGPEWRLSGRYSIDAASSVKMSINRTRQYIHTLSNSASLSPTDTWILSGKYLRPQVADQVALGYYRNLPRYQLELSIEGYYKWLQDLVDFKTGAEFLLNEKIEREVLQGSGRSYGVEVSLTKSGRLNGWVNYTYARTFIRLDGEFQEERVNNGAFFRTSYDKPHTFNLIANYKLTRRISFSMNTTYYTGRPVTVPVATYDFKGAQSLYFSDRNAYRIPDYFRVDLGANLEGNHRMKKISHSFWSLSIYNLLGRDNPYSVFFDLVDGQIRGSKLIVFGSPIPTLTYNFKF